MADTTLVLPKKKIKYFKLDAPQENTVFSKVIEKDIILEETIEDLIIQADDKKLPELITECSESAKRLNEEIKLSFPVDAEDIQRIALEVIKITRNPLLVMELLKPFDDELGELLKKNNIKFSKRADYLIAGYRYFIPPAPPEDYVPLHKGRLLDYLLRLKESEFGFEDSGKFIGPVSNEFVTKFMINNKATFSENSQLEDLLLHGNQIHRVMLLALMIAAKKGLICLKLKNGTTLTEVQFVELLLNRYIDNKSIWRWTIDTFADENPLEATPFDVSAYNYSCRSPFTMNSLILCFPEFLPNLSNYTLDGFYKETLKMAFRMQHQYNFDKGLIGNKKCEIPNQRMYFYIMHAMMHCRPFSYFSAKSYSFLSTYDLEEKKGSSYAPTSYVGIHRRRPDSTHKVGSYLSLNNFFNEQAKYIRTPWIYPAIERMVLQGDAQSMEEIFTKNHAIPISIIEPFIEPAIDAMYEAIVLEKAKANEIIKQYSHCINLLLKAGCKLKFSTLKHDQKGVLRLQNECKQEFDLLKEFIGSKYFNILAERHKHKYFNLLDEEAKEKYSYAMSNPSVQSKDGNLWHEFIDSNYFKLLDLIEQNLYKLLKKKLDVDNNCEKGNKFV